MVTVVGSNCAINAAVLFMLWLLPKLFRLIRRFLDRLGAMFGMAERRDRGGMS